MDVTPRTLREVEFRERMRGYHPEDVDQFLEEVAAGVEIMQERMRQALERAQRAEAAASESGSNDEALRKTLVLAQRTADLAVQEARDQAARILAGAEQQAQGIIADAEEQRRRTVEDATEESRSELARLEISRAQAQEDVDTLSRWLDEHKAHLVQSLKEATATVERAGALWPAPSTGPIGGTDTSPPTDPDPSLAPSEAEPGPIGAETPIDETDPKTVAWSPTDDERLDLISGPDLAAPPPPPPAATTDAAAPAGSERNSGPDDQAIDDFFEDSDEPGEDRRFGGRLRRRR
jgi:cell division initiation protein